MLRGATDYTVYVGTFKVKKWEIFKYTINHFIGIPKTFNKRIPIYVRYSIKYNKYRISKTSFLNRLNFCIIDVLEIKF